MTEFLNLPWLRIAILLGAGYIGLCLIAGCFSNGLLFPRPSPSYSEEETTLFINTPSGERIACLYLKNQEANGTTILFSHGNGEDIGYASDYLEVLHGIGISVFAYDYPGYGQSSGKPTEKGCHEAAQAAYYYLVNEEKVSPDKIILHGRSLGSAPSCKLASESEVGGLILESPFVSAFRVMTNVTILPWDKFKNIDFAKKVSCPSLVIHGEMDEVVPFWHGQRIFDALPEPKTFKPFPKGGHNDVAAVGGEEYWKAIKNFCHTISEKTEK